MLNDAFAFLLLYVGVIALAGRFFVWNGLKSSPPQTGTGEAQFEFIGFKFSVRNFTIAGLLVVLGAVIIILGLLNRPVITVKEGQKEWRIEHVGKEAPVIMPR
jgi:hypothetical protein